jgi:hypothetical protein
MGLILSKLSGARGYLNYGRGIDSDAQAFLTAASITNIVQQKAVNDLVIALKGYSIWNKMKALYPVVGGTAAAHKWNLKDPRDLDAAFRLTFTAGWIHSSTGMTPNGSSDYADTFLTPSISLSQNSTHISVYSRTNVDSSYIVGSNTGAPNYTNSIGLAPKSSNLFYGAVNQGAASNTANTDSKGFFLGKRTASTAIILQKNSTQTSVTVSSTGLSTFKISLGALNAGGSFFYGLNEIAFASIGDGLTDTEAANFYTAVQAFQTTLGRQV